MGGQSTDGKCRYVDVAVVGHGVAAASALSALERLRNERRGRELTVVALEARPAGVSLGAMPHGHARVTFPELLRDAVPDIDATVLSHYDRVAFYGPHSMLRKRLPPREVALVDVGAMIGQLAPGPNSGVEVRYGRQVFDARYVDELGEEWIELLVQPPSGDGSVFGVTERYRARAVIDGSGTGSVLLDRLQGHRFDSPVVCGVMAFRVAGARIDDLGEVSLALDGRITHCAGAWAYHHHGLTPALASHIERWQAEAGRPLLSGRTVESLSGTISDVGVSSMSRHAHAQHYAGSLGRHAQTLFHQFPAYARMFEGAAIVPGSMHFRPSPVLATVSRMAGRRYLLVGDAAGHATAYVGEGVRPAVEMGQVAARVVVEALERGDLSARRLRGAYEHAWWLRYGRFETYSNLFRHLSSTSFDDGDWDTFLRRLGGLDDDAFLQVLKSEYSASLVMRMLRPRLVTRYLLHRGQRAYLTLREQHLWRHIRPGGRS